MPGRVRTAVLISGAGSNMQALLEASRTEDYPAEIVLVVSNRPDAGGLVIAADAGVPAICIDHKAYDSRAAFDAAIDEALRAHDVELVALAGFMRILTDSFTRDWEGRMINIHPSLLPKYKGLHTHRRALEAGDREHGATVHWVVPELDSGEIILQESLAIRADDVPDTLSDRVRALEHQLYPRALRLAAQHMGENLPRSNPEP